MIRMSSYLDPFMHEIDSLHRAGFSHKWIAGHLYATRRVRAPASQAYDIDGEIAAIAGSVCQRLRIWRLEGAHSRRSTVLHIWTPETQFFEDEMAMSGG
jgi:hypothetical protein